MTAYDELDNLVEVPIPQIPCYLLVLRVCMMCELSLYWLTLLGKVQVLIGRLCTIILTKQICGTAEGGLKIKIQTSLSRRQSNPKTVMIVKIANYFY